MSTGPMPSMLTSVAFVVCQVRVVDWPGSIVFGLADSEAVGAVSAGGGVGGGGATFFAHAARNMIVPSVKARVTHLRIVFVIVVVVVVAIACFTDSSSFCAPHCGGNLQIHGRAHSRPAAKPFFFLKSRGQTKSLPQGAQRNTGKTTVPPALYFQLQLGCVFAPLTVNCFTFVPSASMLHIWSLPERWD